jgi:aminopeptidase N
MCRAVCLLGLMLAWVVGSAQAEVVVSPTHYDLDFAIDYEAETLQGSVRIVVQNPSAEPVSEVSLLLYRLFRVRSVSGDRNADLTFTQTVVAFEDFGKLQVSQVLVTLAEPLAPGAETAIRMQYDGYLLGYAETGMHYIQDRIDPEFTILRDDTFVYPQPGYPSITINRSGPPSSFSYSARITVPAGLTVANGGRLDGTDTQGDRVTFRFSSLKPSWRMDFAIAKYGELGSDLIRVYFLPGDSLGAEGVAGAAKKSLDIFTQWFGPLHDPGTFTFIEIPDGFGSQADITAVMQSAAAFRDPERHREVYHEISHLWKVAPTDRPSPRWDEGFASFLEFVVEEEVTGKPVVDERAALLVDWLRSELPGHPEWKKVPLVDYGRERMTDLSYSVGALFFDLLYRLEGREGFNKIVRAYIADFGARGGTTKDFGNVIRKTGRMDDTRLLDDWFFTTAWASRIEESPSIAALEAYYRRGAQRERK